MKQAVILAHPSGGSLNAAIARTYVEVVQACGRTAVLRDLYALDFDPRLRARELPWSPDFAPGADLVAEHALVADANVFVLVYPLWFNTPPAIMKGYVERVFGVAFGYGGGGANTPPALQGRALVSFTTSGAPEAWAEKTGVLPDLRRAFDDYVAEVCGMTVLEHHHFGGVTPNLRPDAANTVLNEVKMTARRLFGPSTQTPT